MLKVRHVGVRPGIDNPLVDVKIGSRRYMREDLPDGSKKWWSTKTINSGCGQLITRDKRCKGLLYCPNCGEYRRDKEFEDAN